MARKKKSQVDSEIAEKLNISQIILDKYGNKSIVKAAEYMSKAIQPISTGSIMLDIALGMPLAPGIIEIAGTEGSGKTTIALESLANAQKLGKETFYMNIERSINQSILKCISGLDTDKLHIPIPDTAEECCDMLEDILRSCSNAIIELDSVAGMLTKKEFMGGAGDENIALLPRLLSKFLPKCTILTDHMKGRNNVILLVNQLRDNIGYGQRDKSTGGRAIPFFATERIFVKRNMADVFKDDDGVALGHIVRARIQKNRWAPPFRTAEIPILYGHGIFRTHELLQIAVQYGFVKCPPKSSWYEFDNGDKVQGESASIQYIDDNEDMKNSIYKKLDEVFEWNLYV
jgi:recombination protein RecA